MEPHVRRALQRGSIIDITTTGRRTGAPRRLEIVSHVIDGRTCISGMPARRKRAWLRNLEADPRMTVHLKGIISADLPATARVIDEPEERRRILTHIARTWKRTDIDVMVDWSPLIEVTIDELAA